MYSPSAPPKKEDGRHRVRGLQVSNLTGAVELSQKNPLFFPFLFLADPSLKTLLRHQAFTPDAAPKLLETACVGGLP